MAMVEIEIVARIDVYDEDGFEVGWITPKWGKMIGVERPTWVANGKDAFRRWFRIATAPEHIPDEEPGIAIDNVIDIPLKEADLSLLVDVLEDHEYAADIKKDRTEIPEEWLDTI